MTGTPSVPYLAVPNNDNELNQIKSYEYTTALWLGIHKIETNGTYIDLSTGSEFLFNGRPLIDGVYPWGLIEMPLTIAGFDCVQYYRNDRSNGFVNQFCWQIKNYICEYNL